MDIWLAEYTPNVKPGTIDAYNSIVKINLKPHLGAVRLMTLSTHAIQAQYNRLQRDGKVSAKTIKNIHGVLHKALQQAVELRYIRFNPAEGCKLPRVGGKPIQPLDNESIDAFLKEISGHRWENIFFVTLFTGMRQGEVLGLT